MGAAADPAVAPLRPGERVTLDAHNAYPYQDRWADRIDRALGTGFPVAIEQDLVWRNGRSIVSHGEPFTGAEPTLEAYFFTRIRPLMEKAVRENRAAEWPLITLNLDFKTNEPEHHRAVWDLLGRYESWLATADHSDDPAAVTPIRRRPLLVLTGDADEQERSFRRGPRLRLFGAVHHRDGVPEKPSNYRRWWNNPWRAVEPKGQPNAGRWTTAAEERLRELVNRAHSAGLWIRFYTLNGHDPSDQLGGWSPGYNFGSLAAVRPRWQAAIRAGVDFVAVDQYEEFAREAGRTVRIEGTLTRADYERLMEREFDVGPGAKRLEISLSYTGDDRRTAIDLGLRGPAGFRGWSGGGQQTIFVGPTYASYGYLAGPIESGKWAVILGVPNIRDGSSDRYTITVRQLEREAPQFPVLREEARWYVGDFHAHSGHSDGRATSAAGARIRIPAHRVFDAARAASLDFVALSDHNTVSHWGEVERMQPYYENVLLLHSREVTTYNGHINTFGETGFIDFRVSPSRSLATILRDLDATGALTSINHPAAPDDERCMGCGWSAGDAATMEKVGAVEIVNGSAAEGPLAGWSFWAGMLNRGTRLTAIGGSDEHTADEREDRKVGTPATVVYATELSEPAIMEGVRKGRVYLRTRGVDGPELEFSAAQGARSWQMGNVAASGALNLRAVMRRAAGQRLTWIRNGREIETVKVGDGVPAVLTVIAAPGDWFSIVLRDDAGVTLYSNAIHTSR